MRCQSNLVGRENACLPMLSGIRLDNLSPSRLGNNLLNDLLQYVGLRDLLDFNNVVLKPARDSLSRYRRKPLATPTAYTPWIIDAPSGLSATSVAPPHRSASPVSPWDDLPHLSPHLPLHLPRPPSRHPWSWRHRSWRHRWRGGLRSGSDSKSPERYRLEAGRMAA